ncbi:hypothetical protein FZI85_13280 [Mycobacterium sp. CBMA293]|uniref:YiaA/YiaB family inner membrane protein n=1 Tax=unclassified Mycolicibacterium TaxID=2636767 RepID=UPI0012DE4BE8|nr:MULTISPECIES: YiaA/YiaB family inner membrane protein [unclassified Mycolicibacterium]MUL47522.1 hypothetical protein [Mycolicibacterium sp. CBMA 360]MUL59509.1 hypothetical protein [Mycolicibacterium sp. CBMA 335]MUL67363.1 hypothetical protein [Mycolicibacterium sp. CBMA 234]MUL71234.1 hypothetical protein [Mycolicibacterium sp. CBMA 311]MUL94877.1 hypothetical protein [Mycolicibacterium sp. CBMA 230]
MDPIDRMSKTTAAFFAQAAIAFGASFFGMVIGIYYLPLDVWQRLFLAMTGLFLVSSAFTLAKVIRDHQEATNVKDIRDEERVEKLIAENSRLSGTG